MEEALFDDTWYDQDDCEGCEQYDGYYCGYCVDQPKASFIVKCPKVSIMCQWCQEVGEKEELRGCYASVRKEQI